MRQIEGVRRVSEVTEKPKKPPEEKDPLTNLGKDASDGLRHLYRSPKYIKLLEEKNEYVTREMRNFDEFEEWVLSEYGTEAYGVVHKARNRLLDKGYIGYGAIQALKKFLVLDVHEELDSSIIDEGSNEEEL